MPMEFAALTFRDGYPRRLPDKGTFWHMGKEVSSPVNQPARSYQHPEIHKKPPPTPPSAEELERFDHKEDREAERHAEIAGRGQSIPINPMEHRERAEFLRRARATGVDGKLRPRTGP